MNIVLNGETQGQVPDGSTVGELLEALKIQPETVVVEINLRILKRAEHASTIVRGGDQVEIVHFVGGGA